MIGVTELPLPEGMSRMESGPVQFGDDWPGVFMRGDHALFCAHTVRHAITAVPAEDVLSRAALEGLAHDLEACRVPFGADPGTEVGGTMHGRLSEMVDVIDAIGTDLTLLAGIASGMASGLEHGGDEWLEGLGRDRRFFADRLREISSALLKASVGLA